MDVILLERITRLGQMGDIVTVKNGYARNFLLPAGKALRASEANKARFEQEKTQLEARNLEHRKEAESVGGKLDGQDFTVIRSAGETGQLYGSVAPRDIAEVVSEGGIKILRSQVRLDRPIKSIGIHEVIVSLHAEVEVQISLNVARSDDEAKRQAAGEDLTARGRFEEAPDEVPESDEGPKVEEFFENVEDAEAAIQADSDVPDDSPEATRPDDDQDGSSGAQESDADSGAAAETEPASDKTPDESKT